MTETVHELPDRPQTVPCRTYRYDTGHGYIYVTVGYVEGQIFETFVVAGKANPDTQAMCEAVGRLASKLIQSRFHVGDGLTEVIKQLANIKDRPHWFNGQEIKSIPDAVARAVKEGLADGPPPEFARPDIAEPEPDGLGESEEN